MTGSRKRPSEGNYDKEKDVCIQLFDQWSEAEQVEFVEHLISRMCHYQHGHINSYLKPMLQRDFITALPGNLFTAFTPSVCSILITNVIIYRIYFQIQKTAAYKVIHYKQREASPSLGG